MIPEKYYTILGLSPGASESEIKRSYRNLAKLYHPDKNPSRQAHEKFLKITDAYQILTGQKSVPREKSKTQKASTPHQTTSQPKQDQKSQEAFEQALKFKIYQAKKNKIAYLQQRKKHETLRSGWQLHIFNTLVICSVLVLTLVTVDYHLPSKISKHRFDYFTPAGYSSFYATNIYRVNFDDSLAVDIIGNGVLNFYEGYPFFLEKSKIMSEPRAIHMSADFDYWSAKFKYSLFSILPYVYMILIIPLIAWLVRRNIWFFYYWYYFTVYISGPFLLYFFFNELRILKILQLF